MNRDKLIEELMLIREQENKIKNQLNILDYEERLKNAKLYEGRYFKEIDNTSEYVRCLFVYSVDVVSCQFMSICINYYTNIETTYFGIEYYNHFNPSDTDWVEIPKEEFLEHYNEVQRRISDIFV